jgi:pimeloyl-ACP methyl ester carboxylesterase
MIAAAPLELPPFMAARVGSFGGEPPQNIKEYDPEWARAFWTGTVAASCDHARMLARVKAPVLMTHHFRMVDEKTGHLMGAMSDVQAQRACELVRAAGQQVDYQSFPTMGHSMHGQDPELFARTLVAWATTLPNPV